MTPWEIIDAALKRRRPARTQKWLADQLGYKFQRVNNWKERGVPHKELRPVADVIGLTVDQIEGLAPLPWERGWPFTDIEPERYYSLKLEDKERIQRVVIEELEKIERLAEGIDPPETLPEAKIPSLRRQQPTGEQRRVADKKRLPDIDITEESKPPRKSQSKGS